MKKHCNKTSKRQRGGGFLESFSNFFSRSAKALQGDLDKKNAEIAKENERLKKLEEEKKKIEEDLKRAQDREASKGAPATQPTASEPEKTETDAQPAAQAAPAQSGGKRKRRKTVKKRVYK